MSKIKAVYIAAEMSPYAKTGGLADVAGSLPKALKKQDIDIISIMPRYGIIKKELEYVTDFRVDIGSEVKTCVVRKDPDSDPNVFFIDNYELFDKTGIYGFYNDGERYAFFCLAALIFIKSLDFRPDIIHLNDWHTGPIALLLKEKYRHDPFYLKTKIVISIHNLRYQGLFSKEMLTMLGLSYDSFVPGGSEFYGSFNFLKTGISYSDLILTVSQTYADEILTPEFGEGLDGHLNIMKDKLFGIINGIDTDDFDPQNEQDMYAAYSKADLRNKYLNKFKLLDEMRLSVNDDPVFGIVSRLDDQKGLMLIADVFENILNENNALKFILLGTGDPYYEKRFKDLERSYPMSVSVNICFDLKKAKHIYAGSDFFLMPSKFEPCGLGQLISMRYGTIPIVRSTGGLKDTVIDMNDDKILGNGLSFSDYSSQALFDTVKRALSIYSDKKVLNRTIKNAMGIDSSWDGAAKEYRKLYERIIEKDQ